MCDVKLICLVDFICRVWCELGSSFIDFNKFIKCDIYNIYDWRAGVLIERSVTISTKLIWFCALDNTLLCEKIQYSKENLLKISQPCINWKLNSSHKTRYVLKFKFNGIFVCLSNLLHNYSPAVFNWLVLQHTKASKSINSLHRKVFPLANSSHRYNGFWSKIVFPYKKRTQNLIQFFN